MGSSLDALAIGWVSNPGREIFSVRLGADTDQAVQLIPLSRNLRPVAETLKLSAPEGAGSIEVTGLITMDSDPNNNIDLTDGFQMLSFPDEVADWYFTNGTLTILPLSSMSEPFQVTYRLCDKEDLCSDEAFIYVDFVDAPLDPESPQPPGSGPTIIVVTTPVRVYVFADDDLDGYDTLSSSDSATLGISGLWTTLLLIISILL